MSTKMRVKYVGGSIFWRAVIYLFVLAITWGLAFPWILLDAIIHVANNLEIQN